MKRAFTLIELIVVIAIIGILAGVLFASFSGGGESAKTAQCLANMRNLAAACQTYAMESGHYPLAGSIEWADIDESDGYNSAKEVYHEHSGWIGWNSGGVYRNNPNSHQASSSWMLSMYSSDEKARLYCLTNGVLWKYISGNRSAYVCAKHLKKYVHKNNKPAWSYLMNAYFGWDYTQGNKALPRDGVRREYGHEPRADRILLFGEIPFDGKIGSWQPDDSAMGTDGDSVLQFDVAMVKSTGSKGSNGNNGCGCHENIGFNHTSGKRACANVIFADGHAEKLLMPRTEMTDSAMRELTTWLCSGDDITFDDKQYTRIEN